MKKLILSVCAIAVLAAVGCKSGGASGSDPKATLESFFKALSKKDIKAAKKLATKESESMLNMMEMGLSMAEKMGKKEDTDELDKFDPAQMEYGETKIEGDKATVPVTNKKENETINFILKKESGAWKVAFDKNTMAGMAGEKMKEEGASDEDMNEVLKNLNSDTLQQKLKESLGALDTLKEIMKDLPK